MGRQSDIIWRDLLWAIGFPSILLAAMAAIVQPVSANGVPHLLLPGGTPVYSFEFGSAGSGNGQFGFLDGVVVGSDGNIYVADSGSHEIEVFDSAGVYVTKWGTEGAGDGQFQYPRDVALDSDGNVYVADTENHRIQKFSSTGVFIAKWGANGSGNGEFNNPYYLTLDASDNVYVCDRDNYRIQKFDADGTYLTQWGSFGSAANEFNQPAAIAIDEAGDVYVVDRGNSRVQKFSADGTFITQWGSFGSAPGQFESNAAGITVDHAGRIHVSNVAFMSMTPGIEVFDATGAYLSVYGSGGFGAGQMGSVIDIATTPTGGIVVSDQLRRSILVFDAGTEDAGVSVAVTMDEDGTFEAPELTAEDSAGDTNLIEWSVSSPALSGTAVVSGTGGAPSVFTYVPNANFNGSDSFEITITDSDNLTDTITVNVTVNPLDDTPIITQGAGPLAVTMDEDSDPTAFVAPTLGATDGDGDTLTWSLSTQALHGTAVVSGTGASPGTFTYVPDDNFNGSDSFTVEVTDGDSTDTIAVDVTINPVNDAPQIIGDFAYAGQWGTPGNGDGQFSSPYGIAMDSQGNFYISDYGNARIQKFDPDGNFILAWGSAGGGDGQFSGAYGLTIDGDDNLYVADFAQSRIQKFDSSGVFILKWGTQGAADGQFNNPYGITTDASGNVYVGDFGNSRVQKFDGSGNFLLKFGTIGTGDGQFQNPSDIVVDDAGTIYVADSSTGRIEVFDAAGNYLRQWGSMGVLPGEFSYIYGLAFGPDGTIYTTDLSGRVQHFTPQGDFIEQFGSPGVGVGELSTPVEILVTASERIYVVDYGAGTVKYFERTNNNDTASVTMDEDGTPTAFALTLRARDDDADTITWSVSSAATNGIADVSGTGTEKSIAYTPNADFNGTDSFDVSISDGNGGTDSLTVEVTINPQQDAPVIDQGAGPLTVEMDEDGIFTPPTISATDIDVGDTLSWSVSSQATYGTATASGTGASPSTFTYFPVQDFNGVDSFIVEVSDGDNTDTITVDVTVNPVNDTPTLNSGFTHAGKWGGFGTAEGEFDFPGHIALDASGNVYVPEYGNNRVQVFDANGQFIRTWGSAGFGDGEFNNPYAVDVDASGNVYVVDSGNNRIQKFDSSGGYLSQWGSSGSGSYEFSGPRDIAVASNGQIYVVDPGNQRVQRFAANGMFLMTLGGPGTGDGQFLNPQSIALDTEGNAYVTDADRSLVQVFDPSGTFVRAFGSAGTDPGQFSFLMGIDVGPDGAVYTADYNGSRVQAFRSTGEFLWQIGAPGSDDGQTANPIGVVVADSGRVYVSEDGADRVQYFEAPASGTAVNVTMDEDSSPTAFMLNLIANDREANVLSRSIASQGAHGTASVSGSGFDITVVYTPDLNFNGTDSFDVQVDDGNGGTATVTVSVTINPQQDAVVIDQDTFVSVTLDEDGTPVAWVAPTITATDVDGDTLTWSLLSQATSGTATVGGDGISPVTLDYIPSANFNGSDSFTVQVSDGQSTDSIEVAVTISPVNDLPVIAQTGPIAVTMDEDGAPQDFVAPTLLASDIDFDSLGWAVTTQASNGTASASGNGDSPSAISYLPGPNFNGSDSFVVSVSDGTGTADITIDVTVNSVNDSPEITQNAPVFVDEGGTATIDSSLLNSLDPDNAADDLHYTVDSATRNGQLEFSNAPGVAISEFTQTDVNEAMVVYVHNGGETVEDSFGFSLADGGEDGASPATGTFVITVAPVNDPPVLFAIGDKEVAENGTLTFTLEASDPEGDSLTFDAANLPEGAAFDVPTATFTWTPGFDQAGVYSDVLFRVTDNGEAPLTDTETINISVGNVNRPPALDEIVNQEVPENTALAFTLTANDPDGDGLTFSATNLPEGASFDAETATFSWTPGFENAGVYPDVTFTVTDDGDPNESDSQSITITVGNVNRMPELAAIGDREVDENAELAFLVTALDADGNGLSFSVDGLPEGATFDVETQSFTWTPGFDDAGTYPVTFTVTDNGDPAQSDSETITITVNETNRAPELNPVGDQEVTEGETLSVVVSGTDPDGNGLTFSVENLPEGATFNGATGTLSWTPAAGDAGDYEVSFVATDDGDPALSDDETITITVLPGAAPEGNLASSLLENFMVADTNGDGMVSREESQILFPELTELQFDMLDLDGDGFLNRHEIRASEPGGCYGPGATTELFFTALSVYIYRLIEAFLQIPQQILGVFYGHGTDEQPLE